MIDWQHIESTVLHPFEEQMRSTPQSAVWHAEGDVYAHTMNVCEALRAMPEYQALPELRQHILYVAALLHDIGKSVTTEFADNDWHAPHHAPVGSRMAREMLWRDYGLSGSLEQMQIRETICWLIRYHSFPPHALQSRKNVLRMHKIAADTSLSPYFSMQDLCLISQADALGRESADRQQMLEQIALCEEQAREEGCWDRAYPFASAHTRRSFLKGQEVWKEQTLYDDTWGEVILLSGLPGTGKDTWIQRHLPETPVISLDAIRKARKIAPTVEQGRVANIAREQAKQLLRARQPFIWNATDITSQMRESLVSLFETYHARVRIVYLETAWNTLLERNASREDAVPVAVIHDMLTKLTPPEAYEATYVEWHCV